MITTHKVLGNAMIQFCGKAATIICSLIIVKILTAVGVSFYGEYLTAYEYLAFFGVIADAGLFVIAVREMSRRPKQTQLIFSNLLSMRMALVMAVSLLAGVVAQFVPSYSPDVKMGIWLTALSMALTIVAGTMSSVLQSRMKIHFFSLGLVSSKIILATLIFLITWQADYFSGNLLLTTLGAGVISNLFFVLIVGWFVKKEVRLKMAFDFAHWKNTLCDSLPYGIALVLQTLYLRLDIILISLLLGSTSVGLYGLAGRILESFLILGTFFAQAILPKLASEEKHPKKMEKTLTWGVEKLLLIALPAMITLWCFAEEIILFIGSPEFLTNTDRLGSDSILLILLPAILSSFLIQLFTMILVTKNRQSYLMKVNGAVLIINALLNWFLLPIWGIVAAALSTIFCELLVLGILWREMYRFFAWHWQWLNVGLIIMANLGLWLLWWGNQVSWWLLLLGVVWYGGILLVWRERFLTIK